MIITMEPLAVKLSDAAEILGISARKLETYRKAGQVKPNLAGSYPMREVRRFEAWLDGRECPDPVVESTGGDLGTRQEAVAIDRMDRRKEEEVSFAAESGGCRPPAGRGGRSVEASGYPKPSIEVGVR